MSNPFGWNYPPGAENDPNAPWNQKEIQAICYCCNKTKNENDMSEEEVENISYEWEPCSHLGSIFLCDDCRKQEKDEDV